jgi:hypothetical protein
MNEPDLACFAGKAALRGVVAALECDGFRVMGAVGVGEDGCWFVDDEKHSILM